MNVLVFTKHSRRNWTISRISNGQSVASMNGRRFHSKVQALNLHQKRHGCVVLELNRLVFKAEMLSANA